MPPTTVFWYLQVPGFASAQAIEIGSGKTLFDIIAPQSTCETWGWIQQQSEQMFYRRNIGPSHVFSWPRACNTQMSKVTGVLLAFIRRKVPTKSIAQVYTPDRDIVGRAGAVRIRNRSGIDLCIGIDEELQEMIDDADRDGDGEVNEEDFSSKGDS